MALDSLGSTLDLCFASADISTQLQHVIIPELAGRSDHYPIEVKLQIQSAIKPPALCRDWQKMDQAKFTKAVAAGLQGFQAPRPRQAHIDRALRRIRRCLGEAIKDSTPMIYINPLAKPGFRPLCQELHALAKKRRREVTVYQRQHQDKAPADMIHEAKRAKRDAGKATQRARQAKHADNITQVALSGDIRQVHKLSSWPEIEHHSSHSPRHSSAQTARRSTI